MSILVANKVYIFVFWWKFKISKYLGSYCEKM